MTKGRKTNNGGNKKGYNGGRIITPRGRSR